MRLIKKERKGNHGVYIKVPDTDEITEAEYYWIKIAQGLKGNDSAITKLTPFVDGVGIQHITGRLGDSLIFKYERIHPIILSSNSKISELIVHGYHEDLIHPGHLRVMAEIQKK